MHICIYTHIYIERETLKLYMYVAIYEIWREGHIVKHGCNIGMYTYMYPDQSAGFVVKHKSAAIINKMSSSSFRNLIGKGVAPTRAFPSDQGGVV